MQTRDATHERVKLQKKNQKILINRTIRATIYFPRKLNSYVDEEDKCQ